MARVVVTLKVMPESVDVDLLALTEQIKVMIYDFAGKTDLQTELEPIAFGLKAIKLIFVIDESLGDTEDLEHTIEQLDEVQSVSVVDVRRAVG
ncbi:elongation factor 1-beta [Candidatus Woesearchaeota archaeon]|nr:elongation factor 1-beta [Candidatus Woesearchaeota archaeon]